MAKGSVTTPNALAKKLGAEDPQGYGKSFIRPQLRKYFARDDELKGTNWVLNETHVAFITAFHNAKKNGKAFDAKAWLKANRARKARKAETPATPIVNDAPIVSDESEVATVSES